jgi:hypothetical protein
MDVLNHSLPNLTLLSMFLQGPLLSHLAYMDITSSLKIRAVADSRLEVHDSPVAKASVQRGVLGAVLFLGWTG